MCKLLIVINKDNSKTAKEKINQFIRLNTSSLMTEPNGYSVLNKNQSKFFLDYPTSEKTAQRLKYRGGEVFAIHTRTSTGGSVGVDGLHLQNIDGWFFGHNGWTNISVKDKSDSYYLARRLIHKTKPINLNRIKGITSQASFTGKMMLYNPELSRLIWFNNVTGYITALGDNTLILTSYKPILNETEYQAIEVIGYRYWQEVEGQPLDILFSEEIENKFLEWDINTGQLLTDCIFSKTPSYSYNYHNPQKWEDEEMDEYPIKKYFNI